MTPITHSQLQNLVDQLPAQKLSLAYHLLVDLINEAESELSPQLNLMLLPLHERRKILAKQAEKFARHYETTSPEQQLWQAGDFIDEY